MDEEGAEVACPREPRATRGGVRRAQGGVMCARSAVVEKAGVIGVGDRVSVLEEGAANLLGVPGKLA